MGQTPLKWRLCQEMLDFVIWTDPFFGEMSLFVAIPQPDRCLDTVAVLPSSLGLLLVIFVRYGALRYSRWTSPHLRPWLGARRAGSPYHRLRRSCWQFRLASAVAISISGSFSSRSFAGIQRALFERRAIFHGLSPWATRF